MGIYEYLIVLVEGDEPLPEGEMPDETPPVFLGEFEEPEGGCWPPEPEPLADVDILVDTKS